MSTTSSLPCRTTPSVRLYHTSECRTLLLYASFLLLLPSHSACACLCVLNAVSGFLQPGDSLTGYNNTEIVENPDYAGAGLWRPALAGFDTLINVLFFAGCALQFSLCVVCCGQPKSSKPDGAAGGISIRTPCLLVGPTVCLVGLAMG